jgi:RHS repeat-associated protein
MKQPKHARQRPDPSSQTTILLAADRQNSVLTELNNDDLNKTRYSAYGQRSAELNPAASTAFNGEFREPDTGWYLLGNGYRAYNPVLKRFHSPDSLSPFGSGGLNAYAYCVGDPINRSDPTGHFAFSIFLRAIASRPIQFASLATVGVGAGLIIGSRLEDDLDKRRILMGIGGSLFSLGVVMGAPRLKLFADARSNALHQRRSLTSVNGNIVEMTTLRRPAGFGPPPRYSSVFPEQSTSFPPRTSVGEGPPPPYPGLVSGTPAPPSPSLSTPTSISTSSNSSARRVYGPNEPNNPVNLFAARRTAIRQ